MSHFNVFHVFRFGRPVSSKAYFPFQSVISGIYSRNCGHAGIFLQFILCKGINDPHNAENIIGSLQETL